MSTHLPQPLPQPSGDLWSRFSADPRRHGAVRAADADRDVAASALNAAFSEGRLDRVEHAERLDAVMAARTLGELVPLVSDVVVGSRPGMGTVAGRERVRNVSVRAWLGLAVLFNVIWLMTVLTTGGFIYYWPMWPMLGTALPLLGVWVFGGRPPQTGR